MNKRKNRAHGPGRLGRLMARLPFKNKICYPLHLALQLYRNEISLSFDSLPQEADGLRIVFVSDIHYGAFFDQTRAKRLIQKINAEKADLLLLGGDYGEDGEAALRFWQEIDSCPEAKLGVFGVLGNHDVTNDKLISQIAARMQKRGVQLLNNDTVFPPELGRKVAVCGTDECYFGRPDLDGLQQESADTAFRILLTHSPDVLPEHLDALSPGENTFFHLCLCGHTHGGQVALFGRAVHSSSLYGNRYNAGIYREHGAVIAVSNGVGTSMLPVRLGARPQYDVITLRKE